MGFVDLQKGFFLDPKRFFFRLRMLVGTLVAAEWLLAGWLAVCFPGCLHTVSLWFLALPKRFFFRQKKVFF